MEKVNQEDKDWATWIDDIDNYIDYQGEADTEDIEPFIMKQELKSFIKKTKQESYDEGVKVRSKYMQNKMQEVYEKGQNEITEMAHNYWIPNARLEERNRIIEEMQKAKFFWYRDNIIEAKPRTEFNALLSTIINSLKKD